jgi:hypothetical protein
MKNLSLLFSAAMAVCAFVMPSMASGSSWGLIATTHSLDSANLSFAVQSPVGPLGWSCNETRFHVDVLNAAALRVTAATFRSCGGVGVAAGCTVTNVGTGFSWTITGPTTTNVQIHNVDLHMRFETSPGSPGSCVFNGMDSRLTGTLTGGSWDAGQHEVTFAAATGLTLHSTFLGAPPVTVTGTVRDTTQTLTLT